MLKTRTYHFGRRIGTLCVIIKKTPSRAGEGDGGSEVDHSRKLIYFDIKVIML